jgi:molybdopterin molybdotransferase
VRAAPPIYRFEPMMESQCFDERLSLLDAYAWLDDCPSATESERISLAQCFGRILTAPVVFPANRPDRDVALVDGYATQAESTLGASGYNPLFLIIVPGGAHLAAGCAAVSRAGETLPPGADSVLPPEAAEASGSVLEVCGAIARGSGVGRNGQAARRGETAITAGRRLDAPQIALAASLGLTELTVRRRPYVALVLAGAKPPAIEALSFAIAALIERDGGLAGCTRPPTEMARSLAGVAPADLVIMIGRSGRGQDDDAVGAIAAAGGRLDHHGLALTPGGSAGLGWLGGTPVLLLPGDPLSALASYELLARRLVRRLAGHGRGCRGSVRKFALSRKIASPVGVAEWTPVVCRGSSAEPLALAQADGLVGYARADGFLIVPAGLEGYASGSLVDVTVTSACAGSQKVE